MLERLKALSELNGVSGDEDAVREWIISEIKDHCHYQVDPMGNLICFKKGLIIPSKRLMLSTSMDEVGVIVTAVTEEGLLKFSSVGSIDPRVLLGRAVKLYRAGIYGVIGTKAVHQQSAEERKTPVPVKDMYLDIGASSREEAMEAVSLGDYGVFCGSFEQLGRECLKGKALDSRAGCGVLIELIQSKLKYDTYFAFTVQGQVGFRGAQTAAYNVEPDLALVVGTTPAWDLSGVDKERKLCHLGKGAVISFMDKGTIYHRELCDISYALAEKFHVPCQNKTMIEGENDAAAVHTAKGGVKTLSVGIPCRYSRTPVSMVHQEDLRSVWKLVGLLSEQLL